MTVSVMSMIAEPTPSDLKRVGVSILKVYLLFANGFLVDFLVSPIQSVVFSLRLYLTVVAASLKLGPTYLHQVTETAGPDFPVRGRLAAPELTRLLKITIAIVSQLISTISPVHY